MKLPAAVFEQHIAVLGKTRSGKSSVMRGLVEQLLEKREPVCIVDPKGDWWGIKLARDGKRPGYAVVIFGGEHADVPINEHAGAQVAELFATGNRPCLIDLGGWMPAARTRFWIDFASTLFRLTRGQRWLVVDEIHNFAPKGKIMDIDSGKALHWTNRLASEGLGKGVPMIFASQRPQKVHNDTLTSAETLIAMRVLHPSDRSAVSDWIKGCGDPVLGAKVLDSLAQMDRGEGWAWSPEAKFGPERIKFPMFKTYDSFRAQSLHDTKALRGWAEVDLDEVKAKLATVVEQAKANDPAELKRTIAELRKQVSAFERQKQTPVQTAPATIKRVEVPIFKDSDYNRMEKVGSNILKAAEIFRDGVLSARRRALEARQQPEPVSRIGRAPLPGGGEVFAHPDHQILKPGAQRRETVAPAVARAANGKLPVGERAVLVCCAQYPDGVTRQQLSILTGYKRSTRDAFISRLQARQYVLVGSDKVSATSFGVEALGNFEPLPTGEALRSYWLERLPAGEKAVLECAIAGYPRAIERDTIDTATGYKRSSRDAYIQRLLARQIISADSRGTIKASELLF